MQDVSTKPLSVDEIINLATAYHYFVWPVERDFYKERDIDYLEESMSGSKLTRAVYYADQIKLTPAQMSLFICHVARITNPVSFLNRCEYWDEQHKKYVLMYELELLQSERDCNTAVD